MNASLPHRLATEALRFTARSHAPRRNRACRGLLRLLETGAALETALRQELVQNDLSEKGFRILAWLSHHDTAASPARLAAALGIPRQSVTAILVRLELSGLISRHRDERDHRMNTVELSPQGRITFTHALRRVAATIDRIMSALATPELTRLEQACLRLRHSSENQTSS